VVHLLVAPGHFRAWWGYGWFFLALAAFHTLYGLGFAVPVGPLPRWRAYLLIGITANLLVLGLSVVTHTRGDLLFASHARQLEPPSGPAGYHAQGLPMSAASGRESVVQDWRCPPSAPLREYRVAAINVEITLNRFLDYDPKGRMYVLEEEVERVRWDEVRNREARAGKGDPAISDGLQGDAIQPLTLRVNQGECLRVALRNALEDDEPASFHLHGSALYVSATVAPALAANPDATATPGAAVTYEWWVSEDEPEGTHYFHSHGNPRLQTAHGLFGAVIVEPRGSRHLDPVKGEPLSSGWAAIIQDPRGPAFREFVLYYHEVGKERYRHLDRQGSPVVQVDPYTSAYRPGDRAMNYRSEPFMNRLALQQQTVGRFDKSAAYSSYVFGDLATPIARSYLGDPVKQRVMHGGSEVFHVHHVHGGSIRWRRQPGVEPTRFDQGLDKHPPWRPRVTERVDSQSIGPSETYDVEHECGSGGCQQGAGDYLVHCHVAHHYLAGMRMIWRVYNTKQDGTLSLDGLSPLAELPERVGQVERAVTSRELVGRRVDWKGRAFQITPENLGTWVERQLPPRGVPKGYDASVLDWVREGELYLNEPETDQSWASYRSAAPKARPPFYFDPQTGKLAYPFLQPHLAKRPPFAPNHGAAPFLEPIQQGTDAPGPGENGPWSLCPEGAKQREFTVHAITLPVPLNQKAHLLDPSGQLYVLKEEEAAVRADNARKVPLAIRANAGEDCVDILFKSELRDSRENAFFSKVNIHIHFVQFDIQGSDGVSTGFNYEQSVRPFATEGEALVARAAAGATSLRVGSTQRFQPGVLVGVGMHQDRTFEVMRVLEVVDPGEVRRYSFFAHPEVGEAAALLRDTGNVLENPRLGLYGAVIVSAPGTRYYHPATGEDLKEGASWAADARPVAGPPYRDFSLFLQNEDEVIGTAQMPYIEQVQRLIGLNYGKEPLARRLVAHKDPGKLFRSAVHGDPATPLLEAFVGDRVRLHLFIPFSEQPHVFSLEGHRWPLEPGRRGTDMRSWLELGGA
jgi:hypothetical protein